MRAILVQGMSDKDFIDLIENMVRLGTKDGIQIFGSSLKEFNIELYDDETKKSFKGAEALSLIIKQLSIEVLGDEQDEDAYLHPCCYI